MENGSRKTRKLEKIVRKLKRVKILKSKNDEIEKVDSSQPADS